ncbi:23S rRNA (pseudouridine(1915)-N(3))-methyltransferase RlmH [Lichenifustis flavocetrariae]|uniref:Ribosomal RNA large subunit methyltransferase H n=1 Tax=Lichenifustis flavocetrariae TaxID=2949735 RepID=A0AA41YTH0_9HYPH|nr:23S rRNA (pseudouridine(1915)-N(3))-methyltransferase RlmH [Lichenifustis flavocetrariae]MCW6507020.1 23S rRNA (pseudouridine(1915)-N(3))-methyltransferase RlmH [Lichenifustis flavocetrariae]
MRLVLLAVGQMKDGPERELLRRYMGRSQAAARAVGISGVLDVEIEESSARSAAQRKHEEAASLLSKVPAGARVIVLDEKGRSLSSTSLAETIGKARDDGLPACCFIIGGADGLSPELLSRSETLSFGSATFPHQLVRVLMAEQIYRIITILAGHPYHRV